jgi:hypothetical protein
MMGMGIKSDDDSCIYDIKSAKKQHMVEMIPVLGLVRRRLPVEGGFFIFLKI